MGYIKEPSGVDFVVDPAPLTHEDRKKISEIIAYYKATGRKMPLPKSTSVHSRKKNDNVNLLAGSSGKKVSSLPASR